MKGRQILLDHMNDRQAAALVEDGKLQDLFSKRICPHRERFIVLSRIAP